MSRRLPWLTLGGASVAIVIALVPAWGDLLQLDRALHDHDQFWRLLTGHFAHWTASHFAWDTIALVVCGAVVEMHSRRRFVVTLAFSALAVSAAVLEFTPEIARYRGLSGIDSALFVVVALVLWRRARAVGSRWATGMVVGFLLVFALKLGFEMAGGRFVFVATTPEFVGVPLAHVVGAIVGFVCGIDWRGDERRQGQAGGPQVRTE